MYVNVNVYLIFKHSEIPLLLVQPRSFDLNKCVLTKSALMPWAARISALPVRCNSLSDSLKGPRRFQYTNRPGAITGPRTFSCLHDKDGTAHPAIGIDNRPRVKCSQSTSFLSLRRARCLFAHSFYFTGSGLQIRVLSGEREAEFLFERTPCGVLK